jgi:hypothetical protein
MAAIFVWTCLAEFYDLPVAEPLAMSTVSEMSEKAPLWDRMVERYGLHAAPYDPTRHAGFPDSIDTHVRFKRQLTRLREMRIVP